MPEQAQPESLLASWENILSCSHELLSLAEQSSWEDMSILATQRDTLIRQYFSDHPGNKKNAAQHEIKIKELLEMDKNILNFYNSDYENLSKNLQSLRNSSKALNAYHNCP